ncbi:tetratricopeptide repeat protein [Sphingorhabdus sp. Alg239-R122]|uniref:tetratricopeptide repeat protein n=1 Tax=Sphingorhabdus sp. Alg239-R122 TaxID=2305989 RepID=UPI0013DD2BD9|nr:tetratricopeptide repeat protein [Sphingorhabdus sp. Alg239-R122]
MPDNNGQKGEDALPRLLGWLEQDPENTALLSDAIEAAIASGELDAAERLGERYAQIETPPPAIRNLFGIIAIQQGKHEKAAERFQQLIQDGHNNPDIRFNLAWSYAVLNKGDDALEMINTETAEQLPQAAALRVRLMHSAGHFDKAMEEAKMLADIHPEDPGLMAAISVLALDVEDIDLARKAAAKAETIPDAITTLGTLALADSDPSSALEHFNTALEQQPENPRAWLGRGMAEMVRGNNSKAASDIDKGAEIFGDHLGSWIAAGWAYFVQGDYQTSRARFETAMAVDPTFAESQGSLAVINVVEGNMEEAVKLCETALRLDRQCFSAALAKSLIERSKGNEAAADRIVKIAMNTPIDANGRTMGEALMSMNTGIKNAPKS